MSQVIHPRLHAGAQLRSHRAVVLAALFALIATAVVVVVVALADGPADRVASSQAQPSLRTGGGPEESHVAANVGLRTPLPPNEAHIAPSLSRPSSPQASGPDESRTASSISGR